MSYAVSLLAKKFTQQLGCFVLLFGLSLTAGCGSRSQENTPPADNGTSAPVSSTQRLPDAFVEPISFEVRHNNRPDAPFLINGEAVAKDALGRTVILGVYCDGARDGIWNYYRPNGTIRATETWKNDVLAGREGERIVDYSGFGYSGGWRHIKMDSDRGEITVTIVIKPLWYETKSQPTEWEAQRDLLKLIEDRIIEQYLRPALSQTGALDSESKRKLLKAMNADYAGIVANVYVAGDYY